MAIPMLNVTNLPIQQIAAVGLLWKTGAEHRRKLQGGNWVAESALKMANLPYPAGRRQLYSSTRFAVPASS
jgi:hypothetical protein